MGCTDKPVSNSTEDLFEVSRYVDGLCSFVRSCDTPMTISIQGDWGSGKTSMMNMMKKELEKDIWPIWFNTWQFSQFNMGNSLVFSMIDVLLKKLDCDRSSIGKILGGIARNVVRVAADRVAGGVVEEMVSDVMSGDSADYACEILELKEKFQKAVNDKLEKEKKNRVVVFVDDLDRLQPIKAIELLEVLKLFLDCDKCVFILAVDYEVVTLGIKEKFGDSVSEEKGRSFFDKIIQLPFKMPVAQYNIQEYVKKMMIGMSIAPTEKDTELYTDLIKTSVGYNPRSMKRLFNTFQLLDIISNKGSSKEDENKRKRKRILFATVCAQMSFEEFYLYLTSTTIDADTFLTLAQDSQSIEELRSFYPDDDSDKTEKKIKRLSAFIPYFIDSMISDDSEELSDDDVKILNDMLKYSVITSVNAESSENDDGIKKEYRNYNKEIVKATNKLLQDIGNFEMRMTHRAHDGLDIYDIFGKCNIEHSAFSLDYCVTRKDKSHIAVDLYVSNTERSRRNQFFNTLGEDPLKMDVRPERITSTKTAGSYKYMNVLTLDISDTDAPEKIADMVRKAYAALTDTELNNRLEYV